MAFCLACGIPRLNRTNCGNTNFTKLIKEHIFFMYEGIFFAGIQICYRKTIPAAAGVWARLSLFHCFLLALHIIISPPCFFSFQSSINHTSITANYHALAPSFPRSQVFIPSLRRLRLTLTPCRDWVN